MNDTISIILRLIIVTLMIPTLYIGLKQFAIKRELRLKVGLLIQTLGFLVWGIITAYAVFQLKATGERVEWAGTIGALIVLIMAIAHCANYFGDRLIKFFRR